MAEEDVVKDIIEKPKPLSGEQRKALLSPSRYVRIVAGAGTGKTETLTRRIAYLLLYKEVDPTEIVAFTFTEKAAQGMKSRIYERVRQLRGERACARLGEMYVGTIHGFCLRILQDHFGHGDRDVLNENQEMAFIMREGWNLGLGGSGNYARNCRAFIRSVNVVYDELIDRRTLGQKADAFLKQVEGYEGHLDRHRLMTFGRMIYLCLSKLLENPAPLSKIKHLIVDEYQDINKAQQALIELVGREASVFIVGDPRQSIYQWRGSDESCFQQFTRLFPGCETIDLTENRRSVKRIVSTANAFAGSFEGVRYKDLGPKREEAGNCFVVEADRPDDEARWVVSQIENYAGSGRCNFNDISILLRSVSTSAGPFIDTLRERGIPYLVGGKVGLFRRSEAQAMGMLFAWLYDQGFWVEDPYNWAKSMKGKDLLISALANWQSATGTAITERLISDVLDWKRDLVSGTFQNFTEAYHEILIRLGYLSFDAADKVHAAIMANLGRFNSLLSDYESSIRFGGRPIPWDRVMKGLCWYMNSYATGAYDEQLSEDIRGINAVQIMTIHQAKGLEWPMVFVPCLTGLRFPSKKTGEKQTWHVPRDMFDAARYEGTINDERRLFYVAITRSKDLLCLSRFRRMKNNIGESPFLSPVRSQLSGFSPGQTLPLVDLSPASEEDEIHTFSAGEIINFMKCPHFYRLRQIWNYQPGLVTPLGYGKSLHFCLRYASELIREGESPERAILRAVEEKFHLPYAGGTIRQGMKVKAQRVLSNFVSEHIDDMGRIEEVEARLEFPVQKATITGRVDVIIKDGGQMEARDYKTSDEVTTPEESALQVTLYALGLRNIGKPVTRASVATLEEARITPIAISEQTIQRARQTAERSIDGIKNGRFEARPGQFCGSCDYSRICSSCQS
ncbi:MAG: ATP-dependent DNA helicase [Thermodesulfobacteriota bacterium]